MNPYLEQEGLWHDFHERFCPLVAELLTGQVRLHYIVKIDEQRYIHELPVEPQHVLPLPAVDVERPSFVEIRDRKSGQLVTVIELLSYSNKYAGPDRDQYLAKRGHLLSSTAHLVEIDLLRGGPRLPCEGLPDCEYYALVSRVEDRFNGGIWPIRLRERLPVIPIPLRPPHGDARIDLQQVLHRIYDAAGYEYYIYLGQPHPRLSPEDAAWSQGFVPPQPGAR